MSTASAGEGIYVGFEVAQERGLTQFVKGIPRTIGEPEDFRTLSITGMYPEELAERGLGRHERRRLTPLVRHIQRRISHLAIVGSTVEPNQDELVAHKKFVAIAIDPSEEMAEARKVISGLVLDEIGIKLPNYNPRGWHISVARRSGRGEKLPPYRRPIPPSMVVSGITVAIRSAKGDMANVRDYVNVPRHRWQR